ncbi:MAG: aminoacyl-tRNA hydrolase [Armatimonadetes bacterium]|nr:aminoacyl-tRNA hydrolase [Armatimonadota bacterium]
MWRRRQPPTTPTPERRVIVGLGNPGSQYQSTRHNVGYMVVDRLLQRWGCSRSRSKFEAELFEPPHREGLSLLLVKPLTYMNLSGKSVAGVLRFYNVELAHLMVVCDDFNLPLGRLRLRREGSHGGQRGLADTITRLGTNQFPRLRIGIAAPGGDAIEHVLGSFHPDERPLVADAVERSCDALELWCREGIEAAMNRYNAAN